MKNNQKGFTLIEMLVVVAIVGLLSSVVVVGVGGAREKARDAKRVADIRQIQTYLEAEYDNGYPAQVTWPTSLATDPSTGTAYFFCTANSDLSYVLGADLENPDNRPTGGITDVTGLCAPAGVTCSATDAYCVSNE
ncbi:MAG: prepilin-type N-terminal cleavage/methylation domain-containing protein [Candidatus Brennerbacteria bacterium]